MARIKQRKTAREEILALSTINDAEREIREFLLNYYEWDGRRKKAFTSASDWDKASVDTFLAANPRPVYPAVLKYDLGFDGIVSNLVLRLVEGYYSRTRVVMFKEKHGDRCFLLDPNDCLGGRRIALKVLHDREDWYSEPEAPEPLDFTGEQVEAMPQRYREKAKEEMKAHKHCMRQHKENMATYKLFRRIIDEGDGFAAVGFLRAGRYREYESYEIILPERA